MDRIAVLSIIIEDMDSVPSVNELLHDTSSLIIGRMGLPLRDRGLSIISVVLSGVQDRISSLSGRLGRIPGITVTVAYAKSKTQL